MTFQDGITLFKSGDYSAAAEYFHQLTQENQKDHKAWNALGTCLSKMGRYSDANTCFAYAIRLDSNNDSYKKNKRYNEVYLKKEEEEDIFSLDDEPDFDQKINENQKKNYSSNSNDFIQQKNNNLQNIQPTYIFWGLFIFGLVLIFIPVVNYFIFIYYLIIVYLVYKDAKEIGVGNPNATDSSLRWSPGTWAAAVFLFWPIFLPYFAYKRNEWCTENYDELGYNGPYSKSIIFWIIIIIIAFFGLIIIAAVFSYVMLGAGFFSTQKAQEVTYSGMKQTSSNLVLDGYLYADSPYFTSLNFYVKVPDNGEAINLADLEILYGVNNEVRKAAMFTPNSGLLSPGERINISLKAASPGPGGKFSIEIIPPVGSSSLIVRTLASGYDGGVIY